MQRLLLSAILLALLWAIGLTIFVGHIPSVSTGVAPQGDAIVVYTGGGARLTAAMSLFQDGEKERLLISGVHPDTTRARIAEMWTGDAAQFNCCVDLGHAARTTEGNAAELAEWARTHEFRNVVLVTSDYHMPRAMAATQTGAPAVTITPYVVSSGYLDDNGRPSSINAWRVLAGEYSKYLLAEAKAVIASFVG